MWFTISRVEITGRLLALRGEYIILEEENIEGVTSSDRSKVKKPNCLCVCCNSLSFISTACSLLAIVCWHS